jgi:hypothetical protein
VTLETVGAELATTSESATMAPSSLPSFGVTSTDTVWPLSPSPAPARLSVSVSEAVPEVVLRVTPFTFQT